MNGSIMKEAALQAKPEIDQKEKPEHPFQNEGTGKQAGPQGAVEIKARRGSYG
ncbi:hypothetical protein APED_20625 [Acanthopleuribacter pedis]